MRCSNRGRISAVIVVLGALLFGLACSSSKSSSKSNSNANTAANAGNSAANAASPAAGAVHPSGTQALTLNLTGEPDSIDPSKVSFDLEIEVTMQLFRGLFAFDQNLNLIPNIATVVPTQQNGGVSPDGLTYTFKLKPNQIWSDGQPVTSQNFAYSLKRELTPGVGGDYASYYNDIKGADALANLKPDDPGIKAALDGLGLATPDSSTLVVTLSKPDSVFPQHMGLWSALPLREDVITKYGDSWTDPGKLVGNGPFLLKDWVHKDHITLVKNPKYSGTDKPYLDTIKMLMIQDTNSAFNAYKTGQIDIASVPPELAQTVASDSTLKNENYRFPDLTTFWLGFNNSTAPFNTNKALRQAFSTALDRDALVATVYKGVSAKTAYSAIPPGMPGYDESAGLQYKFDPAQAKQYLTQAGFPNGQNAPKITLLYAQNDVNNNAAQFIQNQFKQNLGITIELDQVDSKTFQSRFKANDFQLVFIGWGADYPDPENFMVPNFETGQDNNQEKYSNKQFDDLMDQAYKITDQNQRIQLYQQAQKLMLEDAPVLFEFYRVNNFVRKPYVKSTNPAFFTEPFGRELFFTSYYIQK